MNTLLTLPSLIRQQVGLLLVFALGTPCAVASPQPWIKEPDAFRGIKWNASVAEAKKVLPRVALDSSGSDLTDLVDRFFEVGTVTTLLRLTFWKDHLVMVTMDFPTSVFNDMASVFTDKYGPPTATDSDPNYTHLTWAGNIIDLVLTRDTSRQSRDSSGNYWSRVVFETVAFRQKVQQGGAAELKRQQELERQKQKKAKDAF